MMTRAKLHLHRIIFSRGKIGQSGKRYCYLRAETKLALDLNRSAMLHDNAVANAQPETGAASADAGREKRIEDSPLDFLRQARAVVRDNEPHFRPGAESLDENARSALSGFDRVAQKIYHDLLHRRGI